MALGFIADKHGRDFALHASQSMEYIWNYNQDEDPFA